MLPVAFSSLFGKYRTIVIAVGCFLLFDLGVLILNFYTSYQIAEDALNINLAGRQRMLSQRMTKAIQKLETDSSMGQIGLAKEEFRSSVRLFDRTLNAFHDGGETLGADTRPVEIQAIGDEEARNTLRQSLLLWQKGRSTLDPVIDSQGDPTFLQISAAKEFLDQSNVTLLRQMNDLTVRLEQQANAKANRLRQVQIAGIALALINFLFILFKFIRQLRQADAKTETVERERREILASVREGLFLIDHEFRIGQEFAQCLPGLLGRQIEAGQDFRELLADMVPHDTWNSTVDYLGLLLAGRVKEQLAKSLNPLAETSISTQQGERHLSFTFNRSYVEGRISHLLVTVTDITEQVALKLAVDKAQREADQSITLVGKLLRQSPVALQRFATETEQALLEINQRLGAADGTPQGYRMLVDAIFRRIHRIKGEAQALCVDFIAREAHRFENQLVPLREQTDLHGEPLIGVSVALQGMFTQVETLRQILNQLSQLSHQVEVKPDDFAQNICHLLQEVARDERKPLAPVIDLKLLSELNENQSKAVRDITVQLARNAIVHGLENEKTRQLLGKASSGSIHVQLTRDDAYGVLSVRDDGQGLDPEKVRQQLIDSGRYPAAALAELSDKQVLMKIFEPGFSTAKDSTLHAGRGVGLDAVAHGIRQLGGQLTLFTRPSQFTEFRVRFPL